MPTDAFILQFLSGMATEADSVEAPEKLERHTRRIAAVGRLIPTRLARFAERRGEKIARAGVMGTMSAGGGYAGAVVGAKIGAAIGAFGGPIGILAGGVIGGVIGGIAGGAIGKTIANVVNDNIIR